MPIILNIEKRTFVFISESRKKQPLLCNGQCIFLLHVPFCTQPVLSTLSFCHLGTVNPLSSVGNMGVRSTALKYLFLVPKSTPRTQENRSQGNFFYAVLTHWIPLLCCLLCWWSLSRQNTKMFWWGSEGFSRDVPHCCQGKPNFSSSLAISKTDSWHNSWKNGGESIKIPAQNWLRA